MKEKEENLFKNSLKVNFEEPKNSKLIVKESNENKKANLKKAQQEVMEMLEEKIRKLIKDGEGKICDENIQQLEFLWNCEKFILDYERNIEILKNKSKNR